MGRVRPISFFFKEFLQFFSSICFYQFCLISVCILHRKNTNPVLKYPVFGKKLPKIQKQLKKNVFVHMTKYLKSKTSYRIFHMSKNNILASILALITSLLKLREHWPKCQKQQNILFCLILVSGIMNLYVNRIPDIKKIFSFDDFK